ncbi:phosphopantetheine-binding protein [Paenibacillus sp. IITD108]|uniref:phosphopantetheine-binding protein n=1 Tax=Paenibacillus sp. IITD108 TaxID=3116649 RepID=UPI002F3F8DBF
MEDKLTGLIVKNISSQTFNDDQDLRLIGLDSLKMIRLIVEIEEIYDITIPDELLTSETFSTKKKILNVIQDILSKKSEG